LASVGPSCPNPPTHQGTKNTFSFHSQILQ
jgi:hypothetical protein